MPVTSNCRGDYGKEVSEDQKDALATYSLAYGAELGLERAKHYAKNKKEFDKQQARVNSQYLSEAMLEKRSKELSLLNTEIEGYVEELGEREGWTKEQIEADETLSDEEKAILVETGQA